MKVVTEAKTKEEALTKALNEMKLELDEIMYTTHNKLLKDELKTAKIENAELLTKVDQINQENELLLIDIDSFETKVDSLEIQVEKAKKIKSKIETKVIESIKYVEVENDTIKNLMLLNAQNDTIIRNLDMLVSIKDSVILKQNLVIQNGNEIQEHLKEMLEVRDKRVEQLNKDLIKEERKKMFWQATSAGLGIALVTVLII